ncbi:undecaprenyl-diphosphatase [Cryobacterium mesophilum]|uniref:Phosphatase PAP2 family protein n=1 Tax=Terrimesophilobacter mesophilus TaxID=433647 RepID=A0A4R8VDG7_9MICO|nr:phosphatase PAP2 family protein [Terrimesophilobacter mesophilus]MBB5633468.1 undecaprenyl-diphosphatase [Terrimesophilobacter mesophilus]TFB80182.1 phosphatase PAP2 family protein [Terrimesophilobacter mesophilus]
MERHPGPASARRATRSWPWVSGVIAVAVAVALGAIILSRQNGPLPVDSAWMAELLRLRTPWLDAPAFTLSWIGGGWFARYAVPLAMILVLVLVRRRWAALYFGLVSLASVVVVQVLKAVFGRARPEEILVASDVGSFPSGHVANAATIAVALALIFGRTWIWYVGAVYTVVMALSRTYLGAHWLSDTIGGALVGAGIAVIVWAPLASRLNRDRKPHQTTESE